MVLGGSYYNGFFDEKPGKLLKISKAIGSHDERVHLAGLLLPKHTEHAVWAPECK